MNADEIEAMIAAHKPIPLGIHILDRPIHLRPGDVLMFDETE